MYPLSVLTPGAVISMMFVFGCGASLSSYLVDPVANPHEECPTVTHFVATASSETDPEEARDNARSAVVRKVDSAIAVATERITEILKVNGELSSSRRLNQTFMEVSAFAQGHLVKDVGAVEEQNGRFYALACLDRVETAKALELELGQHLQEYKNAHERASECFSNSDSAGFVVALRTATAAAKVASPLIAQLTALVGDHPAQVQLGRDQLELSRLAAEARSAVSVGIVLNTDDLSDAQRSQLLGSVHSALTDLGISAVSTQKGCKENPKPTHQLTIDAEALCAWGSLGHTCNPVLGLTLVSCADEQQVGRGQINDKKLRGVDGRDINRALSKALDKIDEAAITPYLSKTLGNAIPTIE